MRPSLTLPLTLLVAACASDPLPDNSNPNPNPNQDPGLSAEADSEAAYALPLEQRNLTPVGIYDATNARFHLQNDDPAGPAKLHFQYGTASPSKTALVGDWDGDGTDTVGLHQSFPDAVFPRGNGFYLRNSNSSGFADYRFSYDDAPCGVNCVPLVFHGSTYYANDTVALYDPYSGRLYAALNNSPGPGDWVQYIYTRPANWRPHWRALMGDWNGDGVDSIGFFDPFGWQFYLADPMWETYAVVRYRPAACTASCGPITGQWDRWRIDTVGMWDAATHTFYIAPSPGHPQEQVVSLPDPGTQPLTGNFDGKPLLLPPLGS